MLSARVRKAGTIPALLTLALLVTLTGIAPTEAATAHAPVTVTILPPAVNGGAMHVLPDAVALTARGAAVTIANSGSAPLRISVRLVGSTAGCDIRYSPSVSEIPPGSAQIVRILDRSATPEACGTDHYLEIREEGKNLHRSVEVPLLSMIGR